MKSKVEKNNPQSITQLKENIICAIGKMKKYR